MMKRIIISAKTYIKKGRTIIETRMIEVSGLHKAYGKKVVLNGAGFHVKAGTCVGIVGGNGCGKTTLLSILAGAIKPTTGSILFHGQEAVGNPRLFSKYAAFVPQENPLIEELSVKDNLRLWYRGDKKSMDLDLESGASGMLGLKKVLSVPAGQLSGGMKKRLSIASALSNHSPILIMDEPGAALDLICKEEIKAYLINYMNHGGCVVLASHELEELSICDRMYVLKRGVLEEISTGLSAREMINQFI